MDAKDALTRISMLGGEATMKMSSSTHTLFE